MNAIEGKISIDLYPFSNNEDHVKISSSRPLQASKILIGKTPEQALSIIPLLFNICGIAQSHAALSSIQQYMLLETNPAVEMCRDMLVLVENAKEHMLRIFIDWPKLFNQDANNSQLAYLSQLIDKFKSAMFYQGKAFSLNSKLDIDTSKLESQIEKLEQYLNDYLFSMPPENWLAMDDIDSLIKWAQHCDSIVAHAINTICEQGWASQGYSNCYPLPELDNTTLLNYFNADNVDQFIAEPEWKGCCYETTVLTRQFKHPLIQSLYQEFQTALITRWVARLIELANIPQQLRSMLNSLTDKNSTKISDSKIHPGVAQVEAARGRLIHRVEIDQEIISNYQILAPTEWNFHPRGLITQSLTSLKSNDKKELAQLAHLLINAIDPCVGYELRIH